MKKKQKLDRNQRRRVATIARKLWGAFDFGDVPPGPKYWFRVCHRLERLSDNGRAEP